MQKVRKNITVIYKISFSDLIRLFFKNPSR